MAPTVPRRCWRRHVPKTNFITLHFLYFCGTCLVGSVVIWGSATPRGSITFCDSVFMAVSAMSEAGLNVVNLSVLNTFQQVVLLLLIMSGSAILVSAVVVQVRKSAFERKFKAVLQQVQEQRVDSPNPFSPLADTASEGDDRRMSDATASKTSLAKDDFIVEHQPHASLQQVSSTASPDQRLKAMLDLQSSRGWATPIYSQTTAEAGPSPRVPQPLHLSDSTRTLVRDVNSTESDRSYNMQGDSETIGAQVTPSSEPLPTAIRGNSISEWIPGANVSGLNSKQRENLGGIEYRAVCVLAWIVPLYYILWQLLGAIACGAWIAYNRPDVTLQNGLNPWWVGAFNAVSAFNNSGMDLLDNNMVPFQDAYYLLIAMGLLILAGNTCFPVFLRLIVWTLLKLADRFESRSDEWGERVATLEFVLRHPRRCYTHLFPAKHTWWLLTSVVALNGIDWTAFGILSIGNKSLSHLPAGVKVIDGLFQAFAIRSGGFAVVDIAQLNIALQLLYVVMMYISVYPLLVGLRTSNFYEERSVAIYGGESRARRANLDGESEASQPEPRSFLGYLTLRKDGSRTEANEDLVRRRLRGQIAHDAWWMALALFAILLIEERQFRGNPQVFSVFNFIFEIVSAYGCVGVSTGVPWETYSFSGTWHKGSKLILCAVMFRGRHRGLPVEIDRAVLLPGEDDDDDWQENNDDTGRNSTQPRNAKTKKRGNELNV